MDIDYSNKYKKEITVDSQKLTFGISFYENPINNIIEIKDIFFERKNNKEPLEEIIIPELRIPSTINGMEVTVLGVNNESIAINKLQGDFGGNTRIKKLIVPKLKKLNPYAFYNIKCIDTVVFENIESIPNRCFAKSNIQEVIINSGLISIGDRGFAFSNISTLKIPDSCHTLEKFALCACTNLKEVVIGKGITIIPEGCFYNCVSLNKITLEGQISAIEADAFSGTFNLKTIDLSNNLSCQIIPTDFLWNSNIEIIKPFYT